MKLFISLIFTFILSISTLLSAETQYVTDELKVTLRTGTSTSNSILTMLKSGEPVKVIKRDNKTKYTLVETSKGKKGYILTRFLDEQPSGRQLYVELKKTSQQQEKLIDTLKTELKSLKQSNNDAGSNLESLSEQLTKTSNELSQLKNTTRNAVAIMEKNKNQQILIKELKKEKIELLTENNSYKDSTAMDWFIRGSGVSLLAFFIGILVTRIRWKKRNSWGDF